jgi:hypothetical protein
MILRAKAPCGILAGHYQSVWNRVANKRVWTKGPSEELPEGFCVLEFPPDQRRRLWTYATCGMATTTDDDPIELHLFSPVQAEELVELLTVVAHFHRTGERLSVGHSVNFGRPWLPGSRCTFGLISLPYLDGPDLEVLHSSAFKRDVRCLWLIPLTAREVEFKKGRGIEALEDLFQQANFNYADPLRPDVTTHQGTAAH